MRVIGLDIHRTFAQVAIVNDGKLQDHGRFSMDREAVLGFAAKVLHGDDDVVVEATGNAAVIVRLLQPYVRRVVIANPLQVRAIAWAKVKTDKIDAATLARLHASGFLPEVWMPTEDVELQRRVIAERTQLVSQMTRLKNRIQSILHANLLPRATGRVYSANGRTRLASLPLPADQTRTALRHHDELQRLASELAIVDRQLAQRALNDPDVRRLMTIGGVDAVVAASVLAAIGDIHRFSGPDKLVSYLGLNPSVHQSGDHPAFHGHITHQGRGHARGMLVEAAWTLSSSPGPLSAFFHRISVKRGKQVAAVATAPADPSAFAPSQLIIAHAALSDPAVGHLVHDQRIARQGFALAYAKPANTDVKLDAWKMIRAADGHYDVTADASGFSLHLKLTPTQPPLIQGEHGYSRKGPRPEEASYYYSEPQLHVTGTVMRPAARGNDSTRNTAVTGTAWLDHEWSSTLLDANAVGWDWLGANLTDGSALMAFKVRSRDGNAIWAHATLRKPDGQVTNFGPAEVDFTPRRMWRSPRTGALYPVSTTVRTGSRTWQLDPLMDDQELDSRQSAGAVYWEGAVRVSQQNADVGRAYLELTGYADALRTGKR